MLIEKNEFDNLYDNNLKFSNTNDVEEIYQSEQEIENDTRLDIVIKMIKHNRPIQHIIEDTGFTEKEINGLKKIIEIVKRACSSI